MNKLKITNIPDDIWLDYIFPNLKFQDLASMGNTRRRWRSLGSYFLRNNYELHSGYNLYVRTIEYPPRKPLIGNIEHMSKVSFFFYSLSAYNLYRPLSKVLKNNYLEQLFITNLRTDTITYNKKLTTIKKRTYYFYSFVGIFLGSAFTIFTLKKFLYYYLNAAEPIQSGRLNELDLVNLGFDPEKQTPGEIEEVINHSQILVNKINNQSAYCFALALLIIAATSSTLLINLADKYIYRPNTANMLNMAIMLFLTITVLHIIPLALI